MPLMPFQILGIWLRGLLAVAILDGGAWLAYDWYEHRAYVWVPDRVAVVDTSASSAAPSAIRVSGGDVGSIDA